MNAYIDNVYAIVLAAGASSRMGSPKQLFAWGNRSLLECTILNARSILNERVTSVFQRFDLSILRLLNWLDFHRMYRGTRRIFRDYNKNL
jgi:molybdopterin-guanine dinucleotide biosynthesis protein A